MRHFDVLTYRWVRRDLARRKPPRRALTQAEEDAAIARASQPVRPLTQGEMAELDRWLGLPETTVSDGGPQLIRSARDAELSAADWMRQHGFPDARATGLGADEGVDVVARGAVAQVKMEGVATGRPAIQRLCGAASPRGDAALFFSLAGYTRQALEWADRAGVALFEFDYQGSVQPVSRLAETLLAHAPARRTDNERWQQLVDELLGDGPGRANGEHLSRVVSLAINYAANLGSRPALTPASNMPTYELLVVASAAQEWDLPALRRTLDRLVKNPEIALREFCAEVSGGDPIRERQIALAAAACIKAERGVPSRELEEAIPPEVAPVTVKASLRTYRKAELEDAEDRRIQAYGGAMPGEVIDEQVAELAALTRSTQEAGEPAPLRLDLASADDPLDRDHGHGTDVEEPSQQVPLLTVEAVRAAWPEILRAVQRRRRTAHALLHGAIVTGVEGNNLRVSLPSRLQADRMQDSLNAQALADAVSEVMSAKY